MNYPKAKQYIYLTVAGAHFATQAAQYDEDREVLQLLLKRSTTPRLADFLRLLKERAITSTFEYAIYLFNKGYIFGKDQSQEIKNQPLEVSLPKFLADLSDRKYCAISDQEGFLLTYSGFDLEQAEQAALLAVEISGLQVKRKQNIQDLSGSNLSFISITDDEGQSQLRFWPIYYKNQAFFLAIKGEPKLQQDSFTQLVWLLGQRYL